MDLFSPFDIGYYVGLLTGIVIVAVIMNFGIVTLLIAMLVMTVLNVLARLAIAHKVS